MTALTANLCHETSSTTGTTTLVLTAVDGKQSFNDAFGTGGTDVFYYFASHQTAAEWEVGTGHLSDATTLVRDTIINSSNSGAAVNFSAGTKDVRSDVPSGVQYNTYTRVANVKDYGAVGDNSTDDTAAIQACIDDNLGGCIYFPAGTYVVTGLTIQGRDAGSGTRLRGDGWGQFRTEIRTNHATNNGLNILGDDFNNKIYGVSIEGIEFYSLNDTGTGAAIYAEYTDFLKITNCIIGEHRFDFYLKDSERFFMHGCILFNFERPTNMRGSSTACFVMEGIGDGLNYGSWTHQISDCIIVGYSVGPDYAMRIYGTDALRVSNCYIAGGASTNLYISPVTGQTPGTYQFSNCYFDHGFTVGATTSYENIGCYIFNQLSIPSAFKFENCIFNALRYGILADGVFSANFHHITVTGCTFQNIGYLEAGGNGASSTALEVYGARGFNATGNHFDTCSYGIYAYDLNTLSITGNTFYNCSNTAILLDDTINAGIVTGNASYLVTGTDIVNNTTTVTVVANDSA